MVSSTKYYSPAAKIGIILFSFVIASMLNVYPLNATTALLRPQFLIMVLVFWLIFQPRYVGVFSAFAIGIIADLILDTRLGQQGFSAVLMAFTVRFASIYIKQLTMANAWMLACLCLFVFQVSLWSLQLITQSMFVGSSVLAMLMSMLSSPAGVACA